MSRQRQHEPSSGLLVLAALLALAASLHMLSSWRKVEQVHGAGPAGSLPAHRSAHKFDGVVLATYHHTGTSFASCLVEAIAWHMGMFQNHSVSSLHVESNATSTSLSYYLDLAKGHAQMVHGPAAKPPYMLVTVEDMPVEEVCFDTAVMYFDAQVWWHNGEDPGQTCPMACPCHGGVTDCMNIGSCHINNAHANLFWAHVVQDPAETVLNCYHQHLSQAEPQPHDQWMKELTGAEYAKRLLAQGLPQWIMDDVGLPQLENVSVWQHLHALPQQKGLLLEYLHMSNTLWRMARVYQQVHRLNKTAMVIRQEDLFADPVATVAQLLEATRLSSKQESRNVAQYVASKCSHLVRTSQLQFDPNASLSAVLGAEGRRGEVVSAEQGSKGMLWPRRRGKRRMVREGMLMSHEPVFELLCRLSQLLGYHSGNACDRQAMSVLFA